MTEIKKTLKKQKKELQNVTTQDNKIRFVQKQHFKRRLWLFRTFLVLLTIIFILLTVAAKANPYFPIDLYVTRLIQQITNPVFAWVMNIITLIGNNYISIPLLLITTVLFYLGKRSKVATMLFVSTAGAYLLGTVVKVAVARPRPNPTLIHQVTHFATRDSFPSGHVMFYVGFFGFLLFIAYTLLPKNGIRKAVLVFLSLLILLVGPSRMYLGAHWFSDVMAAYVLGFLWLVVIITIFKRWYKQKAR